MQSAASSSSSSSCRKTPKRCLRDLAFFFRKSKSKSTPRLTRLPKLRHLHNIDVGLRSQPQNSSGIKPDGDGDSVSEFCSTKSSPQPLPLPDLSSFSKHSPSPSSVPSDFPLPSPKTCVQVEDDDYRREATPDSDSVDDLGRNCTHQTIQKNTEPADTLSAKCPIDRNKKVFQDRNGFSNIPTNSESNAASAVSAPNSGRSSPSLSPRGMVVGGFPFPYLATQEFYWSSPDMPSADMLMDPFCQLLYDKDFSSQNITWSCPEYYPHHGRGLYPKSPSETASPLYQESNGLANVHPLPLPPTPPLSSQSTLSHQTITKPDASTSQWQKGKLIGCGTFGSVYVATNRETGALCAMKLVDLIPDDPKSAECMQQLEQEIKLLSQLKHPNIVQYYGSEIVGDHFYIYLEYVHPGSINKYVREHCGAITESVVRSFTRHILHGLAYLHSKKTVHRDIKGANLLVDASGVVKLADFGMAKHLNGQAAELSMKGSPYWMAPEIIHAVSQKDTNGELAFAVDIWSLGCTIIEIVNGKPPWSEFEGAAAMFKVWKETPPIPEILSPSGKDFLHCCFRRNPAERPTASMLLEHPFLKNPYPTELQACTQSFSTMKLGRIASTLLVPLLR